MMKLKKTFISFVAICFISMSAAAEDFTLTSSDIKEGEKLSNAHIFKGFGCEGGNKSPALSWSNAPEGTLSYAITAYDPDAPTGSGWWHWNIINIPTSVTSLEGAITTDNAPEGSTQLRNDYGTEGFGGACPPEGEVHRYIFTVYALGIEKLDVPATASNALVGFMTRANALASDSITATYTR